MAFAKEEVTGGDPVIRYTGESVNKNLEPETAEAKRRLTEGEKEITETGRIATETKSTVTEAARKVLYDPAPLWEAVTNLSVGNEESVYAAALGFHNAVTDIVTDMAERAGIGQVIHTLQSTFAIGENLLGTVITGNDDVTAVGVHDVVSCQ